MWVVQNPKSDIDLVDERVASLLWHTVSLVYCLEVDTFSQPHMSQVLGRGLLSSCLGLSCIGRCDEFLKLFQAPLVF